MKKIIKLFFTLFLIDMVIHFLYEIKSDIGISIINKIIIFLNFIISCPAILIDRTYPFYSNSSLLIGISILIINILIQTFIFYMIIKKNNSNINSK
jgi:hypothetical protein